MKRKIINLLLVVSLFFNLGIVFQFGEIASADNAVFVDRYDFEALQTTSVAYDLDGDGSNDTFSVSRYPVYSEIISDNAGRTDFIINEQSYHVSDRRHGAYEEVYITDIDQTDCFIDIILIDWYKGKGAEILSF